MNRSKRKIKAKRFDDCESKNLVTKYSYNNSRGYIVPDANKEQYRCSFFVQTVAEWNQLEEQVVQAGSVAAFLAAMERGASRAPLQ